MSTLTLVLLGLFVVVAAFLAYVAAKPDDFKIERSQRIRGSADAVFARINDLREFNSWNPFAAADPGAKIVYSRQSHGIGAAYEWDSAGKAGKGRMTVVESRPPRTVVMRLEFLKPFVATNTAAFSVATDGPVTNVTWAMTGCTSFLHKLFGTFVSMDKMVGGEFAKGLASLKGLIESNVASSKA
jgi:hypothetical protein